MQSKISSILEGLSVSHSKVLLESGNPVEIPSAEWNSLSLSERIDRCYDFLDEIKRGSVKLSRDQKKVFVSRVDRLCLGLHDNYDGKDADKLNQIINIGEKEKVFLKGDVERLVKNFGWSRKNHK